MGVCFRTEVCVPVKIIDPGADPIEMEKMKHLAKTVDLLKVTSDVGVHV